ncbi:MAG: hypothetical protein ACRD59_12535 [Candidatus Acidiferrales bacterium]
MTTATNAAPATAPLRSTPSPRATDDEILGIVSPSLSGSRDSNPDPLDVGSTDTAKHSMKRRSGPANSQEPATGEKSPATGNEIGESDGVEAAAKAEPANLRAAFDANPELRKAWHDANAYREAFATPEEARHATTLLADLNRMDALFFSRRPDDHAALARAISDLDPVAFQSLARAIGEYAAKTPSRREPQPVTTTSSEAGKSTTVGATLHELPNESDSALAASHNRELQPANHRSQAADQEAQVEFLSAANASAVEGVVAAIEAQVERLLPEGVSKSARTRVVGEIYRELDSALRSNRQLAAQMRDAFRSGSLDAEHQRAIVSMITSRARQVLPGVAKRVLNEWTSTLISANQERCTRQRTAERRIDIAGTSGAANDGRRSVSPRDLDYSRLSDADILNL